MASYHFPVALGMTSFNPIEDNFLLRPECEESIKWSKRLAVETRDVCDLRRRSVASCNPKVSAPGCWKGILGVKSTMNGSRSVFTSSEDTYPNDKSRILFGEVWPCSSPITTPFPLVISLPHDMRVRSHLGDPERH